MFIILMILILNTQGFAENRAPVVTPQFIPLNLHCSSKSTQVEIQIKALLKRERTLGEDKIVEGTLHLKIMNSENMEASIIGSHFYTGRETEIELQPRAVQQFDIFRKMVIVFGERSQFLRIDFLDEGPPIFATDIDCTQKQTEL